MELAAASEMSLGYRVDKQPTWHPIWRARYRVAVDCRPEVLVSVATYSFLMPPLRLDYLVLAEAPGRDDANRFSNLAAIPFHRGDAQCNSIAVPSSA